MSRGETSHSEQPEKEPKFEVKEYSDEYKKQIIDLINDVYENELGWHSKSGRPDLEKIPEMYQRGDGNFWVAVDNGRVIGTMDFDNLPKDIASRSYMGKDDMLYELDLEKK